MQTTLFNIYRSFILTALLLIFSVIGFAQTFEVSGKVIDAKTKEALPFVNIAIESSKKGGTTDIDGKFRLFYDSPIHTLNIRYVGYEPKNFLVRGGGAGLVIEIQPANYKLSTVIVNAEENPAHRIIKMVINNRDRNDPEKLPAFSYTSYNKMVVTGFKDDDDRRVIEDTIKIKRLGKDSAITTEEESESGFSLSSLADSISLASILQDSALIAGIIQDTNFLKTIFKSIVNDSAGSDSIWSVLSPFLNSTEMAGVAAGMLSDLAKDSAIMAQLEQDSVISKFIKEQLIKETTGESIDEFNDFLNKQHLFLMESVTERKFKRPDKNYEKVIGSRISGLKNPLFLLLATQFQSFSFYKEIISIAEKNYVNPISRNSWKKYLFLMEDTTYTSENDTVFIISFQPKKGKNFDPLKGVLYINTSTYAIQNVIAKPVHNEGLTIKIQQKYERINNDKWFPTQLNSEIVFNNISINDGYQPIGISKSYLSDINLDPVFEKRQFGKVAIELEDKAAKKPDEFWNEHRNDSLTKQDKRTYVVLDSIGEEIKIEEKLFVFNALRLGYIPYNFLNLDLNEFLNYNEDEGFRLGLGLQTNEKFSRSLKLGGYVGYGLKDKKEKFGGNLDLIISRDQELSISIDYKNDVFEKGVAPIYSSKKTLGDERLRRYFIKDLDRVEQLQSKLNFRTLRYMNLSLGGRHQLKYPGEFYRNNLSADYFAENSFNFTELFVGFRYAYKEKLIKNNLYSIPIKTKYPIVYFEMSKGLKDVFDGEYSYTRFDLKIKKKFYIKYLGQSSIKATAGYVEGNVPLSNLYNGTASYRGFALNVPNSFATMRMNEFFSSKYVSIFYQHSFGKLLLRNKRFEPELVFITNVGFGKMANPEFNQNRDFNTLEKGYYESGIQINNKMIGIGVFYRYGPYALDKPKDNFSFRMVFSSIFD